MHVRVIDDPAEFLSIASPLLLRDEPRHNLILGLGSTLRDHPDAYADHRLWVVYANGEPVGAALRTPPHNLVLAQLETPAAIEALVAAIDEALPGVVGSVPEVHEFAELWCARTEVEHRCHRAQGIYALASVRPVSGVKGTARPASERDAPLLLDWSRAFAIEALGETDPDAERIARSIELRLSAAGWGFVVREAAGEPVSLAGYGGETPNGIRIGPVYTPPEHRGNGYASALVASVSADRLAEGKRFCFLYTDLANPVSNRIYERIGYEWVCESAEIAFA